MRSNDRLWFCAALAVALLGRIAPAWAQRPRTLQTDAEQAAEDKIVERLKRPVSGHFREQPLMSVLDQLARAAGVTIRLDVKALEDASIGPDSPVTFDAATITLKSALKSMLGAMDLTFLVKNEAIWVTTPEKAGNEMILKVYPVYDLVTAGQINRRFSGYQPLVNLITSTIAPTTWDEVGGPGSIREFRASGALIVSQTLEVHDSIEPLLNLLRRVRDDQHIAHEGAAPNARRSKAPGGLRAARAPRELVAPATVLLSPNVYD